MNCAGWRLRNHILKIPRSNYLSIWRTNLCNPTWDSKEAYHRALDLVREDCPWTNIIMLGRKVAKIFKVVTGSIVDEFGRIHVSEGSRTFSIYSLPHPSGRCFAWNDVSNYDKARELIRETGVLE